MKKIKILLIEDNRLLREGLADMLKNQPDMEVVVTVGDGENILKVMQRFKPEIILLDLGLRSRNSLHSVKLIKKNFPSSRIIMMDLIPTQNDVLEFVQAGVSGFILKDATVTDFLKTVRTVYRGSQILPPNLTNSLFSQIVDHAVNSSDTSDIMNSVRMTKREKQVIEFISEGYTNKEIAQKLHLSTYTVKSHVHNILEKLALRTRVQIAKYLHESKKPGSASDDISLFED